MAEIKTDSALQFALWLQANEPALFSALEQSANIAGARLNGITDFLKSVGSNISTGVSKVAGFLTSNEGLSTLMNIGSTYMITKAQTNALQTQLQNAMAGANMAPLQTAVGANGQPVTIDARTGQPVTNFASYGPSFLSQYSIPIAIGAGVLLLILMRSR